MDMRKPSSGVAVLAGLLALLLVFSLGYALGSRDVVGAADPRHEGARMLQALADELQRRHIKRDVDWRNLYDGAARGMLEALGDPYTGFFDQQGFRRFQEDFRGFFFGIGIFIEKKEDGRLIVVSPIDNTPAARAGLRAGDHITHVDGAPTDRMPIQEAVARIRGPRGTQVKLRILRGEQRLEVTITRDRIEIVSVQDERALRDNERELLRRANVSYVRIMVFNQDTAERFAQQMRRVQAAQTVGLVLDLRLNTGGLVDQCTRVADHFVPQGPILHEVDRDGRSRAVNATPREKYRKPVAVLINEGTASCSEILAGALQDAGVAVLVGQRTFGKGVISSVVDLPGGRGATITSAKYLTPARRDVHSKGIEPDVIVGAKVAGKSEAEVNAIRLDQLRRALEAIRRR
jgi:carboxyl-terminal processing protease